MRRHIQLAVGHRPPYDPPLDQRCLNTNALGIVIHQSGYPTRDVFSIKSITDVVLACQYSIFSSTPTKKIEVVWCIHLDTLLSRYSSLKSWGDLRWFAPDISTFERRISREWSIESKPPQITATFQRGTLGANHLNFSERTIKMNTPSHLKSLQLLITERWELIIVSTQYFATFLIKIWIPGVAVLWHHSVSHVFVRIVNDTLSSVRLWIFIKK